MGRKPVPLNLSEEELAALKALSESKEDLDAARHAQLVLAVAGGQTIASISEQYGAYNSSINTWKQRYREFGIQGLYKFNAEEAFGTPLRNSLLETLQQTPPNGAEAWDVELLSKALAFPAKTIRRYLKKEGIQLRDPEMERIAEEKRQRRENRKNCTAKLSFQLLDGEKKLFGMSVETEGNLPAPLSASEYSKDLDLFVEDREHLLLLLRKMEQTLFQAVYRETFSTDFADVEDEKNREDDEEDWGLDPLSRLLT